MREATVEKHLKERARQAHGFIRKMRWVGHNGAPDRFLAIPAPHPRSGMYLVELKRPGLDAEDHQAREHKRLRDAGVNVVVLDSIGAVDNFMDGDM